MSHAGDLLRMRAARRAQAEGVSGVGNSWRGVGSGDLTPALTGRLIDGVRVAALENEWTPALVRDRLDEAMKTLRIVGGSIGPARLKSVMPEIEKAPLSLHDMIEQMNDPTLHRLDKNNRVRLSALSAQISRADEAMAWSWIYLKDHDGPRRVLQAWLRSRANTKIKFSSICKAQGWPLSTAKDALARAFKQIAIGLNDAMVQVR